MTDYYSLLLVSYPNVFGADELARICGWKDSKAVHQRKCRLPQDERGRILDEFQGTLLPFLITPPGGLGYIFTKEAVYDWLKAGGQQMSSVKKRGRPKGALSRRGSRRAELEAC